MDAFSAEKKVKVLYETYIKKAKDIGMKPYVFKNKAKYWPFFVKVVDTFGNEDRFDPYKFVVALFNKRGSIYPQQMATKLAWNDYLEYEHTVSSEKDLFTKIIADYKAIKNIAQKRNIDSIYDAFKDPVCVEMIERMALDGLFLSFSKIYTGENIDPDITAKKFIVYGNVKIRKFLKDTFKDDLYVDDIKRYLKRMMA